MLRAEVYGINIVLETDNKILLKSFLEFDIEERGFNYRTRRIENITKHKKIYNRTLKNQKTGTQYFEVGLGWAAYIISVLGMYLPVTDVENLKMAIYSSTYRTIPFQELRDYQNDDVLHILKYRYGLCTVMTSYGKYVY